MKTKYNYKNVLNLKYKYWLFIACCLILVLFFTSCEDFIKIDPPRTEIVSKTVFTNDASATSAIMGIYSQMIRYGFASGDFSSFTLQGSLSADDLINHALSREEFATNSIDANNGTIRSTFWTTPYKHIYSANAIIEGLANATALSDEVKKQLEGEAKFIRAFYYFYLVNMFGDVPLHTTTDYNITSVASRTPSSEVYQQIITDLKDAQNLLSDEYVTMERVRPNRLAATALLARVYLYTKDWENAELQATSIINNSSVYLLENDLNNVFLASSMEAIWQLKPVEPGYNTNEGRFFILTSSPVNIQSVELSTYLLNAFEEEDQRLINWVNHFDDGTNTYFYSYKYKVIEGNLVTEYSMVFRLAEQYLIRAEARAQLANIPGSQADLNAIRNRAGIMNTTADDLASLLLAIEQERRVEFFMEWGHRWLDLKRTNRADAVLGPLKAPNWQPTDVLYPIPQQERDRNPNITQNPGY